MWKTTKRVTQLSTGLFLGGFTYRYYTDEGTRRSLTFWREAVPAYLHYRYVEKLTKNKSDKEIERAFNELHDRYAPKVERVVLELRGFYLKTAQLMSTVDFFVPTQYLGFCKRMQDQVPTEFADGEAEEVVKRNLNISNLNQVFSEFQSQPIGSASIGQVHLARLKDTNELVAVKIMGKGVESRFRSDIQTILDFVRIAMPQHVGPMLEIQKQFVTEFDYRKEAENLEQVRVNILPKFSKEVYIPKPYLHLCTKEVLVMEFIPGNTVLKGIKESYGAYAKSKGTTLEKLEEEQKELMRRPDFQYRDISEEEKRINLYTKVMAGKDFFQNTIRSTYNWTIAKVLPVQKLDLVSSPKLLNLGLIIKLLCKVHAEEIMVDGAFNCDPHPGNVILMPDGRLGLIDFGQFKRIPLESRVIFAKIIVALANDDEAEAVRSLRKAGVRSKYNKSEITYKLATFWYDRQTKDVLEGKNIQEFMDYMEEQDPAGVLPEDLVMPGRVSVMMRGLGNAFGLDLSVAKLWEPTAKKVLEENGIHYIPKKSRASEVPDGWVG